MKRSKDHLLGPCENILLECVSDDEDETLDDLEEIPLQSRFSAKADKTANKAARFAKRRLG